LPAPGLPKDEIKYWQGSVTSCDVAAEENINEDGSPVTFTISKTLLGTLQDYYGSFLNLLSIPAIRANPEWQMVLAGLQQAGPMDDEDQVSSITQNTSGIFNNSKNLGLVPQDAIFEQWHMTQPLHYAKYHVNMKRGNVYDEKGWVRTDDRVVAQMFADGAAGIYEQIELGEGE